MDLRLVNGITMPTPTWLTVVTAGEIIKEAISFLALNYLLVLQQLDCQASAQTCYI